MNHASPVLSCTNLTIKARSRTLVDQASLNLRPQKVTALLGPNGAGKTSLLRALVGQTKPNHGMVALFGQNITNFTPQTRARKLAYLPQSRPLAWPAKTYDLIALGRFAYGGANGKLSPTDRSAIDQAIKDCDIEHLTDRNADHLSGGEMARVHLARAFAAQAPLLVADEPVAALDPRHQFRIMQLIQTYTKTGGTALVVLHDIALAARFADDLIWIRDGKIQAHGSVTDTLTSDRLREIYGVQAEVDGVNISIQDVV